MHHAKNLLNMTVKLAHHTATIIWSSRNKKKLTRNYVPRDRNATFGQIGQLTKRSGRHINVLRLTSHTFIHKLHLNAIVSIHHQSAFSAHGSGVLVEGKVVSVHEPTDRGNQVAVVVDPAACAQSTVVVCAVTGLVAARDRRPIICWGHACGFWRRRSCTGYLWNHNTLLVLLFCASVLFSYNFSDFFVLRWFQRVLTIQNLLQVLCLFYKCTVLDIYSFIVRFVFTLFQ